MLSRDEQERLDVIEMQLRADDPRFARRFSRHLQPAHRHRGALALIVLGVVGLVLGVVVAVPALVAVAMAAGVVGLIGTGLDAPAAGPATK